MKKKLGQKIRDLFSRAAVDESFFEDLEDALIEADIGAVTTVEIADRLREEARENRLGSFGELKEHLQTILGEYLKVDVPMIDADGFFVFLVLGVNGVGKTTTLAKMGSLMAEKIGKEKIVFSAADTFRAAAIDQLKLHGERLDIRVVSQQNGADPGAVVWDSIDSLHSRGSGIVLADTAGRMHNKANLMKELQKIDKIVSNRAPDAEYKKILVVDATTGQNGFNQAQLFHEAVGVDFAVLTKYDSSSKGGIAVSISHKLGIPFAYLGVGEKYEDLHPFSKEEYLGQLLE